MSDQTMMLRLIESGKPVMHFGLTKSGDPKHTLMLPYSCQPVYLNGDPYKTKEPSHG